VDNAAHSILRPPTELTNHIYRVGYRGTPHNSSCRWLDVQTVWEEMVRDVDSSLVWFYLYGPYWIRTLRRGKHRLLLWAGQEADGSMQTKTPSKLGVRDEMGRLEKAGILLRSGYACSSIAFSAREEVRARRLAKVGLVRQYGL